MDSSDTAYTTAAYLRVASLAIALYDYLETQPTTFRFYKEHWQNRCFSISLVLFVSIQFFSISILVVSNVGFFFSRFTEASCNRFYLLPPVFKVLQAMISQAILGVRAFNLSRRSKRVGWLLLTVYFFAAILQWVTTLYQRSPRLDNRPEGNCRAFNEAKQLGAWIFYVIAMIYDVGITATSIFYLLKYKLVMKNTMMSKVTRMMMYDGLGYLLVLTGLNVLNILLYKTASEIQTAGSSLGYCVAWIMSQRLLIHLYDASRERQSGSYEEAVTISQNVGTARDVSRVIRAHLDNKHGVPLDFSRPAYEIASNTPSHHVAFPDDAGVQVRVERTVRRDRQVRGYAGYELEDYSRGRNTQNQISSRISLGS